MKSYIEQLMDYNYWANGLILKYAEKLTPEIFLEDIPFFKTSMRNILAHTMFAEWVWLDRMQEKRMNTDEMRAFFRADKYADIKQLFDDWFDLELRMRAFLGDLDENQLAGTFKYIRSDGKEFDNRYLEIFTQLVLHGMQHRSECAAILTELGHSPGNIDYIVYLRP